MMRITYDASHEEAAVRTTINFADHALYAAKGYAQQQQKTLGEAINELVLKGLQAVSTAKARVKLPKAMSTAALDARFHAMGFRTIPSRGGVMTNERVNQLREEEGI
jgi:hypothetical protein